MKISIPTSRADSHLWDQIGVSFSLTILFKVHKPLNWRCSITTGDRNLLSKQPIMASAPVLTWVPVITFQDKCSPITEKAEERAFHWFEQFGNIFLGLQTHLIKGTIYFCWIILPHKLSLVIICHNDLATKDFPNSYRSLIPHPTYFLGFALVSQLVRCTPL